jgi:hypothetical protein
MALSGRRLKSILEAQLNRAEREKGVVYLSTEPVKTGARLDFPQCQIEVPWDAILAFVDREPTANWGHSARYILVNRDTGDTQSFEARFPPFQRGDARRWSLFYQARGVPDKFLAVPK